METRHHDALASAVQRAHQAFLRQAQAAKNCVGGEKRRQQLQASCDKAQAYWCDLREAVALIQQLPAAQTTAVPMGAAHPFAASTYMSDKGPVQTYHLAVDDRLRVVPTLTAEQCAVALRVPDLQVSVRKALERRLRILGNAEVAHG